MKVELTKEWCMNMAEREAAAGDPDCSAGAPARGLVERLRDSSGGHINGLYGRAAADEIERLTELADSEGTRAVNYLRRARKAEAAVETMQARQAELLAVLARLCELNAADRPMARVWSAAQALVDSYKGADARKPCTCDGAGRGPGRACVVKAGGRLGDLWRCADGLGA